MKKLLIGMLAAAALIAVMSYAHAQMVTYEGRWKTVYGHIDMVVVGNQVTGTYMNGQGRIAGTLGLDGRTLTGTWTETSTDNVVMGTGDIVFTLSGDGESFTGLVWHGPQSGVGGEWNGTRVR